MDAVDRYLETDYGLSILRPAYDQLDGNIGVASAFAPGMKENGGVFSHASAFNLVAKAMLGRGDDLYRVYRKVLPFTKDPEVYKVEPYIYSQFAAGPDSPDHGRGAYHWMTGTAAWMFRVVLDYMLGVKADYEGLRIMPCVPSAWTGYRVVRPFRGDVYEISVGKPEGSGCSIASLSLDGRALEGNLVPLVGDGCRHLVDVVLG
jgi:cellobiose phosphorylase